LVPEATPGKFASHRLANGRLPTSDRRDHEIPHCSLLLGRNVFLQSFVFDAAANPAGLAASNGVTAHLGSR
jgi:hypothetical protein